MTLDPRAAAFLAEHDGNPTPEAFAAWFAEVEAEREAAYAARRAALTPHVRKAPAKKPGPMSGPRYFNLMRAIENHPEEYADYRPTNYCGAALTEVDWDKRSAVAKKNAPLVEESRVCPECLNRARSE